MNRYGSLIVFGLMLVSRLALAQEWGDMSTAESLVEWGLGPVLLIIVELALLGVIIYALYDRNLVLGLVGFALVCIIGGVAAVVPDVAATVTGNG